MVDEMVLETIGVLVALVAATDLANVGTFRGVVSDGADRLLGERALERGVTVQHVVLESVGILVRLATTRNQTLVLTTLVVVLLARLTLLRAHRLNVLLVGDFQFPGSDRCLSGSQFIGSRQRGGSHRVMTEDSGGGGHHAVGMGMGIVVGHVVVIVVHAHHTAQNGGIVEGRHGTTVDIFLLAARGVVVIVRWLLLLLLLLLLML